MLHVIILTTIVYVCQSTVTADINSGCPSWGCVSSGSFSLSSAVPAGNVTVKWSSEIPNVPNNLQATNLRGCVSDQVAVVCSTQSGYVCLDSVTGHTLWTTTSMTYPYLPIMDVYGDVIGIDQGQMVYVARDGSAYPPINISVLRPAFSVMLANNGMLLLTSTNHSTGQIVTYNTAGLVCGAVSLSGTVNNVNGTFLPVGHPIIVGFRAYVITQFVANDNSSQNTRKYIGLYRLYAFDLLNYMTQRIRTVWHFDIQTNNHPDTAATNHRTRSFRMTEDAEYLPPIVAFLQGTVYVNIPSGLSVRKYGQTNQGLSGTLWAIQDDGDTPSFVFKNSVDYGQVIVYDIIYDAANQPSKQVVSERKSKSDKNQTLWISAKFSNRISGYSSRNGSCLCSINITQLANIEQITSQLAITRQSDASLHDVLVFGGTDTNGSAHLVAIETNSSSNAILLWKARLTGDDDSPSQANVTWQVTGQIVNVAENILSVDGVTQTWKVGLVAMVWENGSGYNRLHVKAVF